MTALRIVVTGFLINLKMLGTSSFFLLTSIVQPIIFATVLADHISGPWFALLITTVALTCAAAI